MQIRMIDDYSYPLDEPGSATRTLTRGNVFDEPDDIARAAIDEGCAEPFGEEEAAAEAAEAAETTFDTAAPQGRRNKRPA